MADFKKDKQAHERQKNLFVLKYFSWSETRASRLNLKEELQIAVEQRQKLEQSLRDKTKRKANYGYAREAGSKKLIRHNQQKVAEELWKSQKTLKTQKSDNFFKVKNDSTSLLSQQQNQRSKQESPSLGLRTAKIDFLQESSARVPIATQSRNVRFDIGNDVMSQINLITSGQLMSPGRFETLQQLHSPEIERQRMVSSAMDQHPHIEPCFFADQDYLEAQRTWEINKLQSNKHQLEISESRQAGRNNPLSSTTATNHLHPLLSVKSLGRGKTIKQIQSPGDTCLRSNSENKAQRLKAKSSIELLSTEKIMDWDLTGDPQLSTEQRKSEGRDLLAVSQFMMKSQSSNLRQMQMRRRLSSKVSKPPIASKQNSIKPNLRSMSAYKAQQSVDEEIELEAPHSEADLARPITRRTTKIIREGKAVLVENGNKVAPMHCQLVNYMNEFQDKLVDTNKLDAQDKMKKIIENRLPKELKKSSDWFKMRPEPGYLSDKHTYSTMRKISNLKSRKLFVFDDYTTKKQKEDQAKPGSLSQKHLIPPSALSSASKSKPQKKLRLNLTEKKSETPQTYHFYKGSKFAQRQNSNELWKEAKAEVVTVPNKRDKDRKSCGALLHTMNVKSHTPGTTQGQLGGHQKPKTLEEWFETRAESDSERVSELLDPLKKQQLDVWRRTIECLNELDDKADIKDGIAETKGVRRLANEEFKAKLGLVPREQNTKVYKMLKQLRGFIKRDQQLKAQQLEAQNGKDPFQLSESEEETERHENGQDVLVARPNPLEPQPKKRKKKKTENKDQKGGGSSTRRSQLQIEFAAEKERMQKEMPELNLFPRKTKRKINHYD